MCPALIDWSCELAGIEPELIECIDSCCCYSRGWDRCAVYSSQFFLCDTLAEVA